MSGTKAENMLPAQAAGSPLALTGMTPLSEIHLRIGETLRPVWLKLESYNPAGSSKGRTAAGLVDSLEKSGRLGPGMTLVESTSGNLGIALAYICWLKNYRFLAVVDPNAAPESCRWMREWGAEIDVVEEPDENGGYLLSRLKRVREICASFPHYVWTNQYANPANPRAHYLSTGPEIYHQMNRRVEAVFVPVSTGGTLAGVGRYFREVSPQTKIVGVDASGSVAFGGAPGPRKLVGIGSSRKSEFISPDLYDAHLSVSDQEAFTMCRQLAGAGLEVGGSSGATLVACARYLSEHTGVTNVVCLCPDGGRNYQSTIFSDEWMLKNRFEISDRHPAVQEIIRPGERVCL